eukprot:16440890-Heterocapsa_arctica.AAC.1
MASQRCSLSSVRVGPHALLAANPTVAKRPMLGTLSFHLDSEGGRLRRLLFLRTPARLLVIVAVHRLVRLRLLVNCSGAVRITPCQGAVRITRRKRGGPRISRRNQRDDDDRVVHLPAHCSKWPRNRLSASTLSLVSLGAGP